MERVSVLREGRELALVEGDGDAVGILTPELGSRFRSVHRFELRPGSRTHAMAHPGEAVYAVTSGEGLVQSAEDEQALRELSMVYVPDGVEYRLVASGSMTVVGGPCPPDPGLYGSNPRPALSRPGRPAVLDASRDGRPIPIISRAARLVIWQGMGARVAGLNYVVLEPGEENVPHVHESSDDTITVLEGRGSVDDLGEGSTLEFGPGDVVHVLAGVEHKVKADKGVRIRSVGGPCPPDLAMLRRCGLLD